MFKLPENVLDTDELVTKRLAGLQTYAANVQAAIEDVRSDHRYSEAGRAEQIAQLEAALDQAAAAVRAELEPRLVDDLASLAAEESALLAAAEVVPHTLAEWQEAAARAGFVQEDAQRLAATAPAIAQAYRQAAAAGDRVGMFLWKRYGRQALAGSETGHGVLELESEINRAEAPQGEGAKKLAALRERRGRLVEARGALEMPISRQDETRLAARFGIAVG